MKKKNISVFLRYTLVLILTILLIVIGAALEKSWHMTPEVHLQKALVLLDKGHGEKALQHLILANKSPIYETRLFSSYKLATLYHKGAKGVPQDIKKAVFYYEQLAQMKMPKAQYELALLYDVGDKIPENREKAVNYMMEAAKVLPEAKYALAIWIERGYFGKPNQAWAVALYEQAAHAGVENAVKSLISIYHGGYGRFPDNIRREHYWRRRLESKRK